MRLCRFVEAMQLLAMFSCSWPFVLVVFPGWNNGEQSVSNSRYCFFFPMYHKEKKSTEISARRRIQKRRGVGSRFRQSRSRELGAAVVENGHAQRWIRKAN